MKSTARHLLAAWLLASASLAQDTITPKAAERLSKLALSYDAAVERAISPLRQTYLSELGKLKTEFTKAGDLESALAVDAVIRQVGVEKAAQASLPPKEPTPDDAVAPANVGTARPAVPAIKVLPPASRDVRKRDVEQWLVGGVWRSVGGAWFRIDAGGKGARYTGYSGLQNTLAWTVDNDGLVHLGGAGSSLLVRMTGKDTGVGIVSSKPEGGVFNFVRETAEIPALKK